MRKVIGACVRFRLLVVAVAAAIMVLGILRLSQMPVDSVPQNSAVAVDVETQAPGLSAPEVESLVTAPLEKHLRKHVPGVSDVTSDSVAGLSVIELRFPPGTDPDHATALVRQHLPRAIAAAGVSGPPVAAPAASTGSAVLLIRVTSISLSPTDLSVLARAAIVPRLLALPGVAGVSAFGQSGPQLAVLVDPARLARGHVTLAQVVRTAGDAQPVPPITYTPAPITIQPVVPFGTAAAMARLPVAGAAGRPRLGDVVRVVPDDQPLTIEGGSPASPGLVLAVEKSPSADVLAVSREVDQAIAALRPQLSGVSVDDSLLREDTYLRGALANLQGALVAAGVLAALALLALLLQLRLTCTALISMALSLVAATAVLAVAGYTFNALVTLGLLLALALVVTEAAGEAQAIAARIEPGSARTARTARLIAAACADTRGALTWAGLAAVVCVVPLLLATGLTAALLRPMAVAFALAVVVSLVVAVTVTPALAVVLLTVVPPQTRGRALPTVLAAGYARLIAALARSRPVAMAGAVVAVAAGVAALAWLPSLRPGQPAFEDRALIVSLTGPPGVSLRAMDQMVARATSELGAQPAIFDVAAIVGRDGPSGQVVSTNTGELFVTINPDADYGRAVAGVQSIADGTPGLTGSVSTYASDSMAGVLTGSPAEVVTRLYGGDYGELERLALRLRAVIAGVGGVRGTRVLLPVGPQELADIAREAGSRYLDVTALVADGQAGAVSAAIASRLASMGFPPGYRAALVANGVGGTGTSGAALIGSVVAALIGVLLIARAATRSWRLAAVAFGSLPVSVSGGVLIVFTVGLSGQLAASAGLLGVLALATRQAIAVTARAARGGDLGMILTPALVTAVTLAPFVAMGDVPGMELPHTAAAVVLGGLASTTLVGLFMLPVAGRLLAPRPTPDPAAVTAGDGNGQRGQRVRLRAV